LAIGGFVNPPLQLSAPFSAARLRLSAGFGGRRPNSGPFAIDFWAISSQK
jgi:hypothetical protein